MSPIRSTFFFGYSLSTNFPLMSNLDELGWTPLLIVISVNRSSKLPPKFSLNAIMLSNSRRSYKPILEFILFNKLTSWPTRTGLSYGWILRIKLLTITLPGVLLSLIAFGPYGSQEISINSITRKMKFLLMFPSTTPWNTISSFKIAITIKKRLNYP